MWETFAIVGLALVVALIPISLFFSVAFVRAIRPFTERLADVLEALHEDREHRDREGELLSDLHGRLTSLDRRLETVERRLEQAGPAVSDTGNPEKVPPRASGDDTERAGDG